jgi:hypothetical protein
METKTFSVTQTYKVFDLHSGATVNQVNLRL